MRKLLLLLILPIHAFAQISFDQIRTDSGVVRFIAEYGEKMKQTQHYNYFRAATFDIYGKRYIYTQIMDSADRHFTDSITARKWMVHDITGDYRKDLVFYGRLGNEVGVYVFFEEPGSSPEYIKLTDAFANGYPHSIDLLTLDNQNLLVLGSVEHPEWGKYTPHRQRYFLDTLAYRFGYFVEYNDPGVPGPKFDSIDFRTSSGWGGDDWFLRIYKNGTVIYVNTRLSSIDEYNYQYITEKFTKTTDSDVLQTLLDYINFSSLKDSFELKNISDQVTGITTVWFSNGTKKTVRDYALRGNFGLQALYRKFYALKRDTNYKLVKRRASELPIEGDFW